MKTLKVRRNKLGDKGQHIPAFLILSITNSCNLFCKGCYARANGMCNDDGAEKLLSPSEWAKIFRQGADIGIGIMLLAGGEPLLQPKIIEAAAKINEVVFPIFTNGTLIDERYLNLFDDNRNLVPIISLEGSLERTDKRRGTGVAQGLLDIAAKLKNRKILFGASLTVTTENFKEVTSDSFMSSLKQQGCRVVLFIEYVAVAEDSQNLELTGQYRADLETAQNRLRQAYPEMVFISFPGDEKQMGGCLAAGRGFFHINPQGQAEACPFSPYGDCNLREKTLLEVLDSPFFAQLRKERLVGGDHNGGCALFQREDEVKQALLDSEGDKDDF